MTEAPKTNGDNLPCQAVPSLTIGASLQVITTLELKKDFTIPDPTAVPQNDLSIKDTSIITGSSTETALVAYTNNRADISDDTEKLSNNSLASHYQEQPEEQPQAQPQAQPHEQPQEQYVLLEDVIMKRYLENVLRYEKSTDNLSFRGMIVDSTVTLLTHDKILYVINPEVASEAIETLRQSASFSVDLRTDKMKINAGRSPLLPRQTTDAATDPGPCHLESRITPTRQTKRPRVATIDYVPTASSSPKIRHRTLETGAPNRKSTLKSRDKYSSIEDMDTNSDEDFQNKRPKAKDDFDDSKASTSSNRQTNWFSLINQRQLMSCEDAVKVLTYEAITTNEDAWAAMDCNSLRYVVASGCYGKTSTAAFWDNFYDSIPHRVRKLNSAVYSNRWRRTIVTKEKTILRLLKNIGIPQCYAKFIMGYRAHDQKTYGEVPVVAKTDVLSLSNKLKCKNQLMPIVSSDNDEQDDLSS